MTKAIKRIGFFAGVLILLGSGACAQKNSGSAGAAVSLDNEMDSISYIMGASLAANITQANIEGVDLDRLMMGVKDGMEGDSNLVINMNDGNQYIMAFMQKMQAEAAEAAVAEAQAFIDEQEATGEYQKMENGILYQVIEAGDGPMPAVTDVVKVNYEGTNKEGDVFDSSYERGTPAEFPLNRVIKGWTETLKMMPVGSTWKVVIPPGLAYGERGSPPKIGPNEPLTFKIELIEIVEK
ncbi:FKBP-type peptidyl-prolyl cis-trans isomerase [Cryomorphaceae bacterium 1068]|nr:FKBP-type peptidyl-prolyl cis-trans isomerase [Cryomorphaceae bacterium 1068]